MEKNLINLNASIDYLKLYLRASNFLKRNDINTIWQLVSLTEEDLSKFPNIEEIFIENIKMHLSEFNLHLGMTLEEVNKKDNTPSIDLTDTKMFDESIIKHQTYNEQLKELNDNKKRKIIILSSILKERIKLVEESKILDNEIEKLDTALNEKTLKI